MYLDSNSHPDIALDVHQCACFAHVPLQSNAKSVKRISCYIKGAEETSLILEPSQNLHVDYYVDAEFSGLWGDEEDQNTLCVKSCTGFIVVFMVFPLNWVSKLQPQISLSIMESEYISLS